MMKSLKFTSLVLALVLSQTAGANALYSWKHKDGTPTFSPDPPPKGVPFVIVGPDLKPIPQPLPGLQQSNGQSNGQNNNSPTQPVAQQSAPQSSTTASSNVAPPKRATDVVMTPAPGSLNTTAQQQTTPASAPKPDWKPVIYADDPNPGRKTSVTKTRSTEAASPADQVSVECLDVKQQVLLLESKFANAESAAEMDAAIVSLSSYKRHNKGLCGL